MILRKHSRCRVSIAAVYVPDRRYCCAPMSVIAMSHLGLRRNGRCGENEQNIQMMIRYIAAQPITDAYRC